MGVFCDRLQLGSTAALDCRTDKKQRQILQKRAPIPTRLIDHGLGIHSDKVWVESSTKKYPEILIQPIIPYLGHFKKSSHWVSVVHDLGNFEYWKCCKFCVATTKSKIGKLFEDCAASCPTFISIFEIQFPNRHSTFKWLYYFWIHVLGNVTFDLISDVFSVFTCILMSSGTHLIFELKYCILITKVKGAPRPKCWIFWFHFIHPTK